MEPRREPGKKRSGRGTLAGEARFVLDAAVLAAAVAVDLLYNWAACAVFVLFFRGRYRERMRRFILRPEGRGAGALLVAAGVAGLVVLAGCASKPATTDGGDFRSFQGQMRQLRWSLEATADMHDAPKSLEDDLRDLSTDPTWKEDLRFSAESLFLMPDGPKSLEDDLKDFAEPDTHGLKETIEMLGW